MGFKKNILVLPAQEYTGETIDHTVTATNLKNQPDLAQAGIKEGDVIKVVPQEEPKPKKNKISNSESQQEDTVDKSTNRAAEIAENLGVEKVFENTVTGEFFTSENLARLSVSGDKNKVKTYNF